MATNLNDYEKYGGVGNTPIRGVLSLQPDEKGHVGIYIPGVLRADNIDAAKGGTDKNLCLENPQSDINRSKGLEYAFMIHTNDVDTVDWMYYYDDLDVHKVATFTFKEDNKTFSGYNPMTERELDTRAASEVYRVIGENCSYNPSYYYQERLPTFHITHFASTIEIIGKNAFKNNYVLTITDQLLPASLQSIGASAFENCTHLGTLHAEQCEALTTIEKNAFKGAVGTLYLKETVFDHFLNQGRIIVKENQNYIDDIIVVRVPSNQGGN